MTEHSNPFQTLQSLKQDQKRFYYSLTALEKQGFTRISRLPISIRIILESLLRNCDGKIIKEEHIRHLAQWDPKTPSKSEVPFIVSRVILQDFTGVPLLVDLAAMRDTVAENGGDPKLIEPGVPVDLVIDHSVQVDHAGDKEAFFENLRLEFERNKERYSFLKWGQDAFDTFKVVPPGIGIVHQVNLEHISTCVCQKNQLGKILLYPDTLVGTDSHTTMVNGLGVLGWGVGGIEAEAAMLKQPLGMQMPEVIGVHLSGKLREGVTATDLTLYITEMLRKEKVVGKLVEFFGEGAASLTVADRATIGNMAPEYGATTGFFPVDEQTLTYLKMTGRSDEQIQLVREYLTAQNLFGIPKKGEIDFTKTLELNLDSIEPCVSGPKRPQDRILISQVKSNFNDLLHQPVTNGGYGKPPEERDPMICIRAGASFHLPHDSGGILHLDPRQPPQSWGEEEMVTNRPMTPVVESPGYGDEAIAGNECDIILTHGSIVIAAITSCTNTSNPSVMIGAGLLAKKAVEKGLRVNHMIKTSLAPGSRIVTDYLHKTGLQQYLDALGFNLVAYGCTTCIGNSGPLEESIEEAIKKNDLVTASVLSGNRNFEARIHSAVKANYLMSPPLVVAYAIAGKVNMNLESEPLGTDKDGQPVYLKDIWPTSSEIDQAILEGIRPEMYKSRYSHLNEDNPLWEEIGGIQGAQYQWDQESTYIQKPPFFDQFRIKDLPRHELKNLRPLAFFGDSVTTDHISPAGAFRANSSAGQYLLSLGVDERDFNSYGSRRGNHHVMMRGTFANVRIRNKMLKDKEGGYTALQPEGDILPIYDACQIYAERKIPLIIFAGKDYGMGSSRDWAAKGPALLGIKVVVAVSFERIHRSNLIGMGILPLEFLNQENAETIGLTGDETFSLNLFEDLKPQQDIELVIQKNKSEKKITVRSRLDTGIEVEYYKNGGILPYMLRQLLLSKK